MVYLWLLINNSIMLSIVSSASSESSFTTPPSITTSTASWFNSSSNSTTTASSSTKLLLDTLPKPSRDTIYDSFCCINDVFIHLLQPLSLWTISCINFDRYYAICSPLHYNTLFTTRKVSVIPCNQSKSLWVVNWDVEHVVQQLQATAESSKNFDEIYWFSSRSTSTLHAMLVVMNGANVLF